MRGYLAQEDPEHASAGWTVVYALHRQMENAKAWAYLVGHELAPIDEHTAQLAIVVCGSVDAPEQDADRLLEIAGMFPDSESVSGMAIVALMAGGDRLTLSEQQRSRLQELANDFFARYPDSEILRSYSYEETRRALGDRDRRATGLGRASQTVDRPGSPWTVALRRAPAASRVAIHGTARVRGGRGDHIHSRRCRPPRT